MAGTENTIFSDAIIKLKHATKSVADASDKVLEKDEVLLVSPNSGSGTGAYEMRVGDGSTPVKNLPVAINGMKADNINVEEIETIEEENPTLEGGNAIKNLFGRISKKFSWIETMLGKKVNTADIYDGLDSSNAGKVASANAVRQINEKTDKNTTDISTLTSNLESRITKFSENGTSMIFPCSNDSIYLVFDSHRGGINYMCFVIDTSATPHTYRLDNGEFGAVSIDPDTKIATITYCSFYHIGVIFKLV